EASRFQLSIQKPPIWVAILQDARRESRNAVRGHCVALENASDPAYTGRLRTTSSSGVTETAVIESESLTSPAREARKAHRAISTASRQLRSRATRRSATAATVTVSSGSPSTML